MSQYYNSQKTRGLYDPKSKEPQRLSRSKIELFLNCPRCFYLDIKLGVRRPPGYPFALNSAVDFLLKKEFDIHRTKQTAHPLMKTYHIDAVPFTHPDIDKWRENFVGVQTLYTPTNFLITGAVDDVWINKNKELHVVDYKSTSKDSEINLDADWQESYKNQIEIYQWLLKQNGFKVSATGYFVYANGKKDRKAFDGKLEFDVTIISYVGKTDWIEETILEMKECLESPNAPEANPDCDYCNYRKSAGESLQKLAKKEKVKKSSKNLFSND